MTQALPDPGAEPAPSFYGLSRSGLSERLGGMGVPGYRADQLYAWVYQKRRRSPEQMTNLPAVLRRELAAVCDLGLPAVQVLRSRDGTTHKFVLTLGDGARVESVSMQSPKRLTFCVSSQVGCALSCRFCATGLMGLQRNLSAAEIVAQVVTMGDALGWQDDRFNIVFMGMGEPLANLGA